MRKTKKNKNVHNDDLITLVYQFNGVAIVDLLYNYASDEEYNEVTAIISKALEKRRNELSQ